MKQKTKENLIRSSNAIKGYFITDDDGLEAFSGLSVVLTFGLLILLIIAFGTLLGGL